MSAAFSFEKRWTGCRGGTDAGGGMKRMPGERLELSRGCPRRILSPLRLPFRHPGGRAES